MKNHTLFSFLLCSIFAFSVFAEDTKLTEWREKAAKRFGDKPTQEHKAKMLAALPSSAPAKPKQSRRVLIFSRCGGFIHTSIPFGKFCLVELGKKTGAFEADLNDSYEVFTKDNLAKYDAILFNNTTNLNFPREEQKQALMDFMAAGKGVAGIHAASDNFKNWTQAAAMIGGVFAGHPWGGGGKWAFKVDDTKSPITKAFKGEGFWHTDEIYWYRPESFQGDDKLRILVSLDMSKNQNIKPLIGGKNKMSEEEARKVEVAVSWIREFNGGRVFYTNIGHRDDTFWQPAILEHYLAGIQYALGDLSADATPSASAKDLQSAPAPEQ